MKVMLIQPYSVSNIMYQPINILYLASVIRSKGYEVSLIDLRFDAKTNKRIKKYEHEKGVKNINNYLNAIKEFNPDMCGITIYTDNHSYLLVQLLKRQFPSIKIVVGGPHPTALPESTLKECEEIDYVVHGEGEQTFSELLNTLSNGDKLSNVKGIAYREGSSIVVTPPRELIKDIDTILFPAYDLIPNYKYRDLFSIGKKRMLMFASRGCPYRCNFCFKVLGDRYRKRNPSNVVEEMKMLKKDYLIDEIAFFDALFPLNKNWLNEFFDELDKHHLRIYWFCETRVDHNLSQEDFYRLRKYGCTMIGFGIESGNEDALLEIDKRITIEQAYKTIKFSQEAGIATITFFILGHKNDNYLKLENTLNAAKKLNSDFVVFSTLTLFPGTKVFSYLPQNMQFDKDGRYILDNLYKSICNISEKHLWRFMRAGFYEYFFRFKYFVKNIIFSKAQPKYLKKKLFLFFISVLYKPLTVWYKICKIFD